MGLIYEPVAEQPSHVASAATATWEYQNLTTVEKQAFERGDCPRESHELWCKKWRGHSSLQVRIPELQDALHLALEKVGIPLARGPSSLPSPESPSAALKSSPTPPSSMATSRPDSPAAQHSPSPSPSDSPSPSASQSSSPASRPSTSSAASSSAAAALSRSSETPAAAQTAAATDAGVTSSSKDGSMLESAKGLINSKLANTVASEW